MSDKELTIPSFGLWIPQVFYDFIGRIIPGGLLIFLGGALLLDVESIKGIISYLFKDSNIPGIFVVLMLMALSYAVGIFLSHTVSFFEDKDWKTYPQNPQEKNKPEYDIPFIYDAIQHYYPVTGARLAKLSAERSLSRVFMLGFPITLILFIVMKWKESGNLYCWFVLGGLFFATIAAFFFNRHLKVRSRKLMFNNYYLLKFDNKLKDNASGSSGDSQR